MPYATPLQLAPAEALAPRGAGGAATNATTTPAVPDAAYSVNRKALRRWSEQRLTLARRQDGSIDARFRYDGTTCSNLGQPLAFDYDVLLAPRREKFRLLHRTCRPAAGDVGYRAMCQYARAGEELMATIADEAPPLGASLVDAMAWPGASSPAGCYCDSPSRRHKWGLVLETIHFALAHGGDSPDGEPNRTEAAAP